LPTRYRLEPDRTGRYSFFEPMSPGQDMHRPCESAVPHFWYLPARIACGFIALCGRDSTAPGRAGLIASDATPRSTRGRAFFDYARWEAVPVAFKQAWRKRPTAYARPRSLYSTNFLYIQRRPSWRRQTLRFAELSRRRFQSDRSVCGDSNLGTRCVAALFNPVELQQTVEHSIADRYGQSVPQFPNARPQVVQDLTLSTIWCIRFHWVVVQLFTTFRLSGRIGRM
jgi:hypothetical protein